MRLALFDIDGTLIQNDSEVAWCRHLTRHEAFDMSGIDAYMHSYVHGGFDFDEFMRFQLEPLTRVEQGRLESLRELFLEEEIRPEVSPSMLARIVEHRERGHALLAVSAAHDFIAAPICALLGLDEGRFTRGELLEGRHTGRYVEPPCFGAGKITHVDAWLDERGSSWAEVEESWFYSDSYNDLPLLERVDHPVAVRPDDRLRAAASAAGWEIHDEA